MYRPCKRKKTTKGLGIRLSYFIDAYNVLREVYGEGKYLTDAVANIPNGEDRALITRIVYGVIEKDVTLTYIIGNLTDKTPKPQARLVLKIGLYCLRYMDSLPNYSVCDNAVKLVKAIGKPHLAGFINATLKRAIGRDFVPQDKIERLSVNTSTPLWITKKVVKQYKDDATAILSHKPTTKTHIRRNGLKWVKERFQECFKDFELSEVGGIYAEPNDEIKSLFNEGKITYQSPLSMKIAQLSVEGEGGKILDVCSAPGGKSVYMSELAGSKVLAFDIHPHRVELIKKYADRMGAKVEAVVQDATVFIPKYAEIFDVVLCDVPCSGIGVRYSKPDVLLNRQESDIPELCKLQEAILDTSSRYVKVDGALVYSTCTIFEEENERVVKRFTQSHPEFSVEKVIKSTPGVNGDEGFFAVKLRRNI